MTLEILQAKDELRNLIDAYATLSDEKKIAEVMGLFTPDTVYTVYMNGTQVARTDGTASMEKEFNGHAALVKAYFTLNGQHTVNVTGDTATGVSYSQIKMTRASEGADILTDYSVQYHDTYVRQAGKWLIKERIGHFIIIEARPLPGTHA
jgi:ketosteroid isomerase-like protein